MLLSHKLFAEAQKKAATSETNTELSKEYPTNKKWLFFLIKETELSLRPHEQSE